jgi:glutamyl-Q tRNA(Asp) synthetase
MEHCRFAPTTSGPAHPGTLLAALLCWLDARSQAARLELRLEDIDHTRCTPASAADMRAALSWLGLDWDATSLQSDFTEQHERALDRLAEQGRLYPCNCSRSEIKRGGLKAADGGFRYPGTCQSKGLPPGGWREASTALRFRLEPGLLAPEDDSGLDLAQDPAREMGDPVLRRRDGAIAYHLGVVVDDAQSGVTRIVRGRDLASATATQVALQNALGYATPAYRHHLLLLEERGAKLAKLHGAVGWNEISPHWSAARLRGFLARAAGLIEAEVEISAAELLDGFDWNRVEPDDAVVRWHDNELALVTTRDSAAS